MPASAKKDLYIAKSMGQLNGMAELPSSLKNNNAKLLVKTADKMLKEAQHSEVMADEERAYVLYMKYFNVVTYLKKSTDYKKQKAYYDDLLGKKNLLDAIGKAEELSVSLKDRYDEQEAAAVAGKLAALDAKEEKKEEVEGVETTEEKSNMKEKGTSVSKKDPGSIKEPSKEPTTPAGMTTCKQLFDLLEDRDAQVILMDVRPIADFHESRINHSSVINVPADVVPAGTTVTYIEKLLPSDSQSLWKQRGNIDHIILLDWNSSFDSVKIGSTLQTLKDALFKYDSTVIIKSEPLILDGGYEQWLLHYPTRCISPDFQKLSKPVLDTSQSSLMDFDYPDFDETFLKPKPVPPQQPTESSQSGSGINQTGNLTNQRLGGPMNGDATGNMPQVDRSTKPKVDRSTKVNVTTIEVKSKVGSLYPDVGSIHAPLSNQIRGTVTNTDARAGVHSNTAYSTSKSNSTLADQRSENSEFRKRSVANGSISKRDDSNDSISKLDNSSDPSASAELRDLERLKREKQAEFDRLQAENERMRREGQARLEKLHAEEKRLEELEEMRRKQQTDVADLMRLKKSLQEDMRDERQRVERENIATQREEDNRRQELATIAQEEKRRQEEVAKLRMDRKKKEEDARRLEIDRKLKEEKELQEAQDRARQLQDQRDAERASSEEKARQAAAEERARQQKLDADRQAKEEADRQRERQTVEERIRQEKELQQKLEKERQAALEEKRRQQAELDRQEQERREAARLEKERLERERQEKERKEREELDRQRAEEAKRLADEKLRRMNEAKAQPRVVPSPNLLVGWEKQLDPRTNRYFYINHKDNTTQWEPPAQMAQSKGSTYTTRLKEEPREQRRGLSRSNSSPNIAKMVEDEAAAAKKMPSIDRGNKPRPEPIARPVPMPAKRRDFNPVYGNVGRALTGLRNLGNTCYMNSTIQCLNNTSPLVTYLLTDGYLYDINRESPLGNDGEVPDDFAYIVKALWCGQYRFISPRDFKAVVGKHQPMFAGYDQQDSQEFLTFLLDGLHEGLNKVKTRPKIPEQDNDRLSDGMAAELAWKNHKLQNESIIVELFQGQLKSTIMCLTCRKKSVTFQAFMFLSLPIPSSSRCSLQDCLRQFSCDEKMTGSSRWKCPQCKCYRDSAKKIEIWKLPRILLIALNRFVYEGQWRTKINANVDFPTRDLDMTGFVRGPRPRPYKLYAVSNHFGTLDGGHYTASCRNPCTQKWYKFDDHEVYETSESSVKTSAAYVLYYTSIELPPPDFRPRLQ